MTFSAVTSGYLQAIGARLVDGRFFDASDERGGGFGIVLSASAVRALSLPGHVAGTTLPLYLPGLRQRGHPTIVGIVRDIDYTGLEFAPGPAVYVLWHELPASQLFLAVRTRGEPAAMVSAVARAIRTADPALPIVPIRSMQAQVRRSISNRTARALFSGSGAVLAFVIAAIGLAGGLGRAVTERRRELAIRSALGATPVEVVRIVAVEAALVVGAGVVLGAVGGVAGAKLLRWALFGVTPYDPAAVRRSRGAGDHRLGAGLNHPSQARGRSRSGRVAASDVKTPNSQLPIPKISDSQLANSFLRNVFGSWELGIGNSLDPTDES